MKNILNEQERRGNFYMISYIEKKIDWSHSENTLLLYDVIEGQMTEVKVVGRRTQLLHDLRNRKRYWELKKEVEDRKSWKRQFTNQT